jgi:hypothetical protein
MAMSVFDRTRVIRAMRDVGLPGTTIGGNRFVPTIQLGKQE